MRHKIRSAQLGILILGVLGTANCGCGGGSTNPMNSTPAPPAPVAASVTSTIAVGTVPDAIAVDSTNNKIFVTDFGTTPTTVPITGCSNSGADIRVIDGATQATAPVGVYFFFNEMNPFAATLNPASHSLYVLTHQYSSGFGRTCGLFGNPLETFDATSLQQTANFFDLGGAGGIAANPTSGNVYVARGNSVVVMTLNIGTNSSPTVLASIPVGTNPVGVAVDTATNRVYVANSGSNDVSVIDGSTNAVVTKIADPAAVHPVAIAVNPATNLIYVANSQSNNLTVIDGATDTVIATIPVGTSPSGVDVDSQTNFIYVANAGNSQVGDLGNITVINGATPTTLASHGAGVSTLTDPQAKNPVAVGVNSVTNKIYVANSGSNNVTVIDGAHE